MRFLLSICCVSFVLVSSCAVTGLSSNNLRGKPSPSTKSTLETTPTIIAKGTVTPTLDSRANSLPQPTINDQIAYVYNATIQMVDLATMNSENLTSNSDDRWPVWSPDGQYLIYERRINDVPNLYIWDSKTNEHKLLVEKACCAAWNPSEALIAFLSFADYFPLEVIQSDRYNRRVLLSSTDSIYHDGTGNYNHPNGPLLWSQDNILYLPLETDNPLMSLIFKYSLDEDSIGFVEGPGFPSQPDCSINFLLCENPELACLEAPAQSPSGHIFIVTHDWACAGLLPKSPQLLIKENADDWKSLAQGTNWSWSPDGTKGVYEAYTYCKDGNLETQNLCLTGISIMNLNTRESQLIIEGGEQPAWRPIVAP